MKTFALTLSFGLAIAALSSAGAARADDPLGGKSPWNFQPVNRAALAIAIKEVEDPGSTSAGTIVCGGTSGAGGNGAVGSASSATANDSCIIVSNSNGAIINTDQHSHGDQDADSDTSTTTNNKSGAHGSIDAVDAILNGNKQGF